MGVALGLDPALSVVAVQTSNVAGKLRALATAPAVILIDCLSLAAPLRQERPNIRLIAIGLTADHEFILAAARAGIDGCVDMRASTSEVIQTVKRVYAGEAVYDPRTLCDLLGRSFVRAADRPRRTASLARRELEVLEAIAIGMTTSEAAQRLDISVNTLRTHLKNILLKLEARSKLEAVLIAIREGRIELPEDLG